MRIVKFKDKLQVKIDTGANGREDLWMDGRTLSELFEKDYKTIQKHINNIYKSEEVGKDTSREIVVITEKNGKKYKTTKTEYNLDVILSVGYKVNGKLGTEFRQWANEVLGKYLRQGYAINENVIAATGIKEITSFLGNIQKNLLDWKRSNVEELDEVLGILKDYGYALTTLQEYDEDKLVLAGSEKHTAYVLDYDASIRYIARLKEELVKKGEATVLFGQEKTHESLGGILGNIFNGFFGVEAYPSLEERASHILYFIIKDHPFNDGNKRIASFLFSLFLKKNDFHLKADGNLKVNDTALAALAVMIAESNPKEKDQYIKLLVHTLRKR